MSYIYERIYMKFIYIYFLKHIIPLKLIKHNSESGTYLQDLKVWDEVQQSTFVSSNLIHPMLCKPQPKDTFIILK